MIKVVQCLSCEVPCEMYNYEKVEKKTANYYSSRRRPSDDTYFKAGMVLERGDGKILVVKNCVDDKKHVSFPKGHVKRGESPLKCAFRELFEETGVRLPVGKYQFTKFTFGKTTYYYAKVDEEDCKVRQLGCDETDGVGWWNLSCANEFYDCNRGIRTWLDRVRIITT